MATGTSWMLTGLALGGASGFTPGPLCTLVISQTLKHGAREGVKISCSPLITDAPVILLALFALSRLAHLDLVLSVLSLAGALFIFSMAYENLTYKAKELEVQESEPHSLKKGIMASALSPYPYLFWMGVGSPFLVGAFTQGPAQVLTFILSFYVAVFLAKMCIITATVKAKPFLSGQGYVYCIRSLGVIIGTFGLKILWTGITGITGLSGLSVFTRWAGHG